LMAQLAAVRPTAIVTLGQSAAKDVLGPSASLAKDRKSTRLNSSHVSISYAVFCLKKKMSDRHVTTVTLRDPAFAFSLTFNDTVYLARPVLITRVPFVPSVPARDLPTILSLYSAIN